MRPVLILVDCFLEQKPLKGRVFSKKIWQFNPEKMADVHFAKMHCGVGIVIKTTLAFVEGRT
jgi:hypothetical protein